jgi:DNA-binding transcriptional MerR regulator
MTGSIPPSQAAEQSGFSLDTLRYYERIGLLDDIGRAPSGHRRFREEDLEWLGVLRCLRDTGMSIAQMRRYAELARCGEPTMAERLTLLIEHDGQVRQRIAALQAEHAHLQEKIDWYRGQLPADDTSDPVLLPSSGVLCGAIRPKVHPMMTTGPFVRIIKGRLGFGLLLAIALPLIQALVHRLALAAERRDPSTRTARTLLAGRLRGRRRVPAGGPQPNA